MARPRGLTVRFQTRGLLAAVTLGAVPYPLGSRIRGAALPRAATDVQCRAAEDLGSSWKR
jgi:hypothetical protein